MGLWAPSGVPPAVTARMREATLKALQSPELRRKIQDLGMEVGAPATTEEMAVDIRESYERQGKLLRSIHYTPQ